MPHTERKLDRRVFLCLLANLPAAASAAPDGLHDWGPAPDFRGIRQWFNSPALSLAALKGQVVLVDFWTYACINCLRTLPHVNRWAETYRNQGLVVVGVHTPEFAFERSASNVQAAIKRHGVKYPVAMDNDHATWKAYENRYWPAHYLVDGQGRIRYRHFGEGGYARTEAAIQTLLAGALEPR
jgi:thiol-disulfide isomerase/thioredoxin